MEMKDKIREAFQQIHAEDSLKETTKQAVYQKMRGYDRRLVPRLKPIGIALACFFICLLGAGSYLSYRIPVAAISIDVNPSLELEVNRYEKVIRVNGYNDDGLQLAEELEIQHMQYEDALQAILENKTITRCLQEDGLLEITVAARSMQTAQQMRACIIQQTKIPPGQVYCMNDSDQVADAHALGLSLGKYRVFLELQALVPEITAEEVQGLSMRALRDWLEQGTPSGSGQGSGSGQSSGSGQHTKELLSSYVFPQSNRMDQRPLPFQARAVGPSKQCFSQFNNQTPRFK